MHDTSKIEIRDVAARDLKALAGIDSLCFPNDAWDVEEFRYFLENSNSWLWAIEEGKTIIAFIMLEDIKVREKPCRRLYIANLAVHPDKQRRGLAGKLMERTRQLADEKAFRAISLHVATDNLSAISFYEKLGFTRRKVHKDYYGKGRDSLVMTLDLDRVGS